jgi:hypothetical protein
MQNRNPERQPNHNNFDRNPEMSSHNNPDHHPERSNHSNHSHNTGRHHNNLNLDGKNPKEGRKINMMESKMIKKFIRL